MSTVFIFRIILAVVAGTFVFSAFAKFMKRENRQTIFKLIANSFVWISVALFAIFPSTTHLISERLGFGESLNTLIFIGFVIVFVILFKIINMIERTERNISEIVRKEALDKIVIKK